MRPATAVLGEFVASCRYEALPADVIEAARCHLLFNLACGAAAPEAAVEPALRLVRGHRPAEATLLRGGERVPAGDAAFANGVLLHARAQDDTHVPSQCHPGATIIPAALAVAERQGSSPRELIGAVVAGYEVTAALGELLAADAIARGFRASPVFGTLGAAAALAALLDREPGRVAGAIALATSFAGGLNQTWLEGSSEWLYHLGLAARNGVAAALLAAAGERGAAHALEGPAGFVRAFSGREGWEPPDDWQLGERWRVKEVVHKAYPVCSNTQTAVALASDLASRHDLAPEGVAAVRLYMNPEEREYPGTLSRGPFAGVSATLMSAPYCVAMALKHRGATLAALEEWEDATMVALVEKVDVLADPRLPELGARLELVTVDGSRYESEVRPAGDDLPSWDGVVAAAGRLAAELPGGGQGLDHLMDTIRRLEDLADIRLLPAATVAGAHGAIGTETGDKEGA